MITYLYNKYNSNKGFYKFLLLVLVFLCPLFLAHMSYKYFDIAGSKTNQGQLLKNPPNLSQFTLDTTLAQRLQLDNTDNWKTHRWTIIYFVPEVCNDSCFTILHKLQQVHIGLGKNLNRVQRLNIYSNSDIHDLTGWRETYSKLPHITIANLDNSQKLLETNYIYLSDPLGNIILSYKLSDNDFDKKIFKDTKKLLNISKIG